MPLTTASGRQIAAAEPRIVALEFGPWLGSMRSVPPEQVPKEWLANPSQSTVLDFVYRPKIGGWKRRGGQSIQFDTHGSVLGLLPSLWSAAGSGKGARVRDVQEFLSDSVTDGIPTVGALVSTETVASGLDDGYFAQFWWRDRVNGYNRTLNDDFNLSTTYPAPSTVQTYRMPAFWYQSGDGGYTRGTTEYNRRFFLSGARSFKKAGRWWYSPGYRSTPLRTLMTRGTNTESAPGTHSYARPISTLSASGWQTQAGVTTNIHTAIDETSPDDSDYIRETDSSYGNLCQMGLTSMSTPAAGTPHTLRFRIRRRQYASDLTQDSTFTWTFRCGVTSIRSASGIKTGAEWTSLEYALTAAEIANITDYTILRIEWNAVSGATFDSYFDVSFFTLDLGAVSATVNRMMPSGPIPPCFSGTVSPGSAITEVFTYPDADVTDGAWLNTAVPPDNVNLFSYVDEVTTNDADYIYSSTDSSECVLAFATPATTPTTADAVTIRFRASSLVSSGFNTLNVHFRTGATTIASTTVSFNSTSAPAAYSLSLTADQIQDVIDADSTWANIRIAFAGTSLSGSDTVYVTQVKLGVLAGAADAEGGWKGKDRFLRGIYYRFEDDSVWALTVPRFPNTLLTNGLDLVTVDSANPDVAFTKITHNNIPIPPHGVKKVGICRSPKIDSSVDDNLLLNPFDMRLIAEVDPGTTSYDDYAGDDDALGLDVSDKFIRHDHKMPPRCRYNAAGDMRMAHAYGSENPCAITIAPVGATADYDLNVSDSSATAYAGKMYMRFAIDGAGAGTLTLNKWDGATTVTTESFAVGSAATDTYGTLQKLVDGINVTNCAQDSQQWRAQLLPDVSGDAVCLTTLAPHSRTYNSCVVDDTAKTITLSTGGLSKIPLGYFVLRSTTATGAYIDRINSDTVLHYSGTITGGTVNLTFYCDLGDSPVSGASTLYGYQRVIANSLPGFLYKTVTYLNTFPTEKNAVWMTVANPGSVRCAPNCFITTAQSRTGNKFTPPLEAGILTGVAAVDQGFVVLHANKKSALRSRSPEHLNDEDYTLVVIDENEGCIAWNTVASGNRFAVGMDSGGMFGADLYNVRRFSKRIYAKGSANNSDFTNGMGDFAYEIPQSIAATAQDNDSSYATARVIGSVVWVCYRASSAASTHANRVVLYDFSAAPETTGLSALFRQGGEEWGWSAPLNYGTKVALVGSGRRSGSNTEGLHVYGWNDENAGTVGDGRLDELETGETDNSVAISGGTVSIPWIQADEGEMISVQRFILEHNSPAGSTGSVKYHRSYSNDSYTLTPGTSALDLLSELKHLTTPARALTAAGYFEYLQASGSARELRKLKIFLHRVKRLR